jgi:secreted Zn-dependent insulinase-like peptidase
MDKASRTARFRLCPIHRLMEQAPALHTAFMEPSVKKAIDIKMLLSFEEQELIEKVVKLLEPFKRATIILSSKSEPTLPAVMPE